MSEEKIKELEDRVAALEKQCEEFDWKTRGNGCHVAALNRKFSNQISNIWKFLGAPTDPEACFTWMSEHITGRKDEHGTDNYDERKLRFQPMCGTCKHCLSCRDKEGVEGTYCMLGVSEDDLEHVRDISSNLTDFDSRLREIMKLFPESTSFFGSPRWVAEYFVCQFYERRL